MRTLAIAAIVPLLVAGQAPCAAPPSAESVPIGRLIEELGAQDFDVREAAAARLGKRSDACQALRQALRNPDAEVRRRAGRVLAQVQSRRLTELLADGDWDQAVELLLLWGSKDDVRGLPDVCKLAGRLVQAATSHNGKLFPNGRSERLTDFTWLGSRTAKHRVFSKEKFRGVLDRETPRDGAILRASQIDFSLRFTSSLIVANGDVKAVEPQKRASLTGCLLLSTGEVTVNDVSCCLLLSDGPVSVKFMDYSLVIARGEVVCRTGSNNVIISGSKVSDADYVHSHVSQNDDHPLKLVRFFDVKRLGVEVESVKGGVKVKAVPHGTPFSATVRPGDVITAVAGKDVADAEAFRKLLRPHAAEQATVALTLLRDGKRIDVNVSLRP
jgi:hypothetical protein